MLGPVEFGQIDKLFSLILEKNVSSYSGDDCYFYNSNGDLISKIFYSDSSKKSPIIRKDLIYNTSGDIIGMKLTRYADGKAIIKNLVYNQNGDLTDKVFS